MAPAAFWTSPHISPRAPTELAAKTDRKANWNRAPQDSSPLCPAWTPSQNTATTPPNTSTMEAAVMIARAVMRLREVRKERSTAAPKRSVAVCSRPKACTVSRASRVSPAWPTARANSSWVAVVRLRRGRANRNRGTTTTGMISNTSRVSLGLTQSIRTSDPIMIRVLRRKTEAVVARRFSMIWMSVVRRDRTSPVRVAMKKAGSRVRMWP